MRALCTPDLADVRTWIYDAHPFHPLLFSLLRRDYAPSELKNLLMHTFLRSDLCVKSAKNFRGLKLYANGKITEIFQCRGTRPKPPIL